MHCLRYDIVTISVEVLNIRNIYDILSRLPKLTEMRKTCLNPTKFRLLSGYRIEVLLPLQKWADLNLMHQITE